MDQAENKTLKKTLITAICLFLIDAFLINQGTIAILVLLFVVFWLTPKCIFRWFKKQSVKLQLYQYLIYSLMVISVGGANFLNNKFAKSRADQIIAAVEKFYAVNNRYPMKLNELAPDYIKAIPRAKYTLYSNKFSYDNLEGDPFIYYVNVPPFGRTTYHFNQKKWGYID